MDDIYLNDNKFKFLILNENLDIDKLNGKKIQDVSSTSKSKFCSESRFDNLITEKISSIDIDFDVNKSQYPLLKNKTKKIYTNVEAAFLQYFASLSVTNCNAEFDFSFVATCIEEGCDINCVDIYGQTVMHEIAREWHTDVALFLYAKGGNIDQADYYGRTPLFVAVVSNHLDMIKWLLQHGANIDAKTCPGEEQHLIHYAAKYNRVEAMKLLMSYGASPHVYDKNYRTPLHVAAEQGREDVALYLLRQELPAGTYTSSIVLTLQTLTEKLPNNVVKLALQQFCHYNKSNRSEKYYLSNLELKRGRRIMAKRMGGKVESLSSRAKTPLETIVEEGNLELITHPVITQLLQVKRERFGRKYTMLNIILYLIHTITLTLTVALNMNPNVKNATYYIVLILASFGFLLNVFFTIKLFTEYRVESIHQIKYKEWKCKMLKDELTFCHPQWKTEKLFLQTELNQLHSKTGFWHDAWNWIESFTLLLTYIYALLTLLFVLFPTNSNIGSVRKYYSIPCLLAIWLRLNRSLMIIKSLGPFINVLGRTTSTTIQFGFLFMEFFVPMVCGFWVLFGGERKDVDNGEFTTFQDTLYQLFLLAIVGDYDYDTLSKIDKLFAQIYISLYFVLVSIVCVNLYIALLSEKFSSVHALTEALAYMNEAKIYLQIEKIFPNVNRHYEDYLQKYGAPMVVQRQRMTFNDASPIEVISDIQERLKQTTRDVKQTLTDSLVSKAAFDEVQEKLFAFDEKHSRFSHKLPPKAEQIKVESESFVPAPLRKPLQRKISQLQKATSNFPFVLEDLMEKVTDRRKRKKRKIRRKHFFWN